jgi:pimeloyl-ACP methyl ester carboxylesterase
MPVERHATVGNIATRYWEADGRRPEHPVVFVHGNPTSSDDWLPFLARLEGERRCLALDLVGWGKSERPRDFPYTIDRLAWFVRQFIDELALERFDMVVHDWGVVGLLPASRRPESVGRVVIFNCVPLTAQFRWHWAGRLWRTPLVGELMFATTTRFGTLQILRQATPRRGSLPEVADHIHRYLDGGTKRAILRLYRDADPDKLDEAGRELGRLRAPTVVIWGDRDSFIQPRFGDFWAAALGGEVRVEHLPDAGHWVWLDRPDAIDMTADFLAEPRRL